MANFTKAQCYGYRYRANAESGQDVKEKTLVDNINGDQFNLELYGAPNIDFLDCGNIFLPGVVLHLRFCRSHSKREIENLGNSSAADIKRVDQTRYSAMIEEASLFVNMVVFPDSVKVTIERVLTKSTALYPCIESLNCFIIRAGQICFVKDDSFGTELVRRLTVCTVRNDFFSRINIRRHASLPNFSGGQI